MRDLPPLKSLRVFEACVRLGSFTKAARELNVGQPAISHQINVLERDLGIALFERRGALTVPTADALTYCRAIASALGSMAKASSAIRRRGRQPALTVATYPGIAMFWLMPRLAKVKAADPALVIRVTTAERDQDMPMEDVDCAILFGDGNWPGFECRRLIRESAVPVAAPAVAARLAGQSRDSILRSGPLIHLEDVERRWFSWLDWRDRRAPDVQEIDLGMTVTNHGISIHQTLVGNGIALGWMGVVDELIENGLLVAIDPEPITSERGYHLVARAGFLRTQTGGMTLQALCPEAELAAHR